MRRTAMIRTHIRCSLGALAAVLLLPGPAAAQAYTNFESGQVRPIALSRDGTRLFATNTPDGRLEIFDVSGGTPVHAGSVSVGLEPVAVAVRDDTEVWVVNHLSDSVSVVDVASTPARVKRTLLVGDEPRDIVFAGPSGDLAFISAAHRGQNNPNDPQLTTPGAGRTDVWVFDATNLGSGMGGEEAAILTSFGDTPRALTTDGSRVWVSVFHSGNRTTTINDQTVCDGGATAASCSVSGFTMPGGLPAPNQNAGLVTGPETGLIVRQSATSGRWEDELGRNWSAAVRFNLPDYDVFEIDATTFPPALTGVRHAGVGTINFNAIVNPVNGNLYVTNTEARNEVRFEGLGTFFGNSSVIGHLHESRITVISGSSVLPRHLNKHIPYSVVPSPPGTKSNSLATPLGMAITADGSTLYVAAFGSSKVGILDTAQLENDTFVPGASSHISVSGGGPTGLALDEATDRLYVLTRFDNSISVIDTTSHTEVAHVPLFNPEPPEIVAGRPFLYDAAKTSSNGEASCSSCHVFGDLDSLAWDLGNPDEVEILNNPGPFMIPVISGFQNFHPLKGPMTTQTLRGMSTHGPMHWRGDRTGGNDPGGSFRDEDAAFKKFNPAFVGLLGRAAELSEAEMQAFADFILTVKSPPNPIRFLDNSLTAQQQAGRNLYFGRVTDTVFNCNGCHVLNPAQGFFGTDGSGTFDGETQAFKVAQLRNMYAKVGMFGLLLPGGSASVFPNTGDQIRGSGYLHDGSVDTLFRFFSTPLFSINDTEQRQLESFMLAFDSETAPIVGQQITLGDSSALAVDQRIDLLTARAAAGECDVVVKGTIAGEQRGAVRLADGSFQLDRAAEVRTDLALRAEALVAGQELTYTCVPPGSGVRIGIDRDLDGTFDRDEIDAGSDPADPLNAPDTGPVVGIASTTFQLRDDAANPSRRKFTFKSSPIRGVVSRMVAAQFGGDGDPTGEGSTGGGATIQLYKVGGDPTDVVTMTLPAGNWKRIGRDDLPGYLYADRSQQDGPIKSAKLLNGKLILKGSGDGLYDLAGAPQRSMAMRVRLGSGDVWCALAVAREPAIRFDTPERFFGESGESVPGECPRVPEPSPSPTPTPPPGSASAAFLMSSGSLLR